MNTASSSAQLLMTTWPKPSMACTALLSRLSRTWLICDGAQEISGSWPRCRLISALSLVLLRAINKALRIQSLISTSSLIARSSLAKSLSPTTNSAICSRPYMVSANNCCISALSNSGAAASRAWAASAKASASCSSVVSGLAMQSARRACASVSSNNAAPSSFINWTLFLT
ncbi:hypothetical protein [Pseudomonas sp. S9]|uniref:hypothetical protein n=1 Tax=Pseudomonas sp. S9 TaxID=686578 RepID=UPI003FD0B633